MIVPQPLTIKVPITGYPTPVAKWTFAEKELTTADERVTMTTKSSFTELIVTPSVRPDKGTYTLQLENDVTSVSGEIEVNVIGTAQKNLSNPEQNRSVLYLTTHSLRNWKRLLTTSGSVKCLDLYSCSPAAPSAPKDFKVMEVTRQHVHLSWEAPEHDGGSPLTGYQVEKRDVSRKTWVKVRHQHVH